MGTVYNEEKLTDSTRDIHRALASLQEELEAVDWYNQRVDTTTNEDLKAVLEHNRNEEVEHACMLLEWLRRKLPVFDTNLRTYLFTDDPITELEHEEADSDKPPSKRLKIGNLYQSIAGGQG